MKIPRRCPNCKSGNIFLTECGDWTYTIVNGKVEGRSWNHGSYVVQCQDCDYYG